MYDLDDKFTVLLMWIFCGPIFALLLISDFFLLKFSSEIIYVQSRKILIYVFGMGLYDVLEAERHEIVMNTGYKNSIILSYLYYVEGYGFQKRAEIQ